MKNYIALFPLISLCGCVTASTVKPEDPSAVSTYNCETLQAKLAKNGAMRDKASSNQNLGSSKAIIGEILIGSMLSTANHMNAVGNEKSTNQLLAYIIPNGTKKLLPVAL
jgi:hypothetical protein